MCVGERASRASASLPRNCRGAPQQHLYTINQAIIYPNIYTTATRTTDGAAYGLRFVYGAGMAAASWCGCGIRIEWPGTDGGSALPPRLPPRLPPPALGGVGSPPGPKSEKVPKVSAGRSLAVRSGLGVGASSDGRRPPPACGPSSASTASSYARKEPTSTWGTAAERPSDAPTREARCRPESVSSGRPG